MKLNSLLQDLDPHFQVITELKLKNVAALEQLVYLSEAALSTVATVANGKLC